MLISPDYLHIVPNGQAKPGHSDCRSLKEYHMCMSAECQMVRPNHSDCACAAGP